MMFCKYCGAEISEDSIYCPVCGKNIVRRAVPESERDHLAEKKKDMGPGNHDRPDDKNPENNKVVLKPLKKTPDRKKLYIGAAAVIAGVVLIAVIAMVSGRCRASGCRNRKAPGSDYCYNHKCDVNGCRKERMPYSNYCYEHHLLYDEDENEVSGGAYSWELNISDVLVYSEYNYTYAEGSLTNNSDSTVKFIKLKGAFKNSSGTVIDTDWTYAVGGEGLGPGESCKWKMHVTKDVNIKECDVSVMEDN